MIKHIVMWTLADHNDATEIKTTLEALKNSVPSIIELEVGIDYSKTDCSADIVLCSTFADRQALNTYQNHPEHQAVLPMMQRLTTSRKLVDYEI